MTTRSIFQKVCPGCMTTLPTDAKSCTCGFGFDRGDTSTAPSSEEIRLNAEELYETYLAARARQAAASVKDAQIDFARDPANKKKSARVAQTIDEAQTAKEALAAQSAHIAQLRKSQLAVAPSSVTPVHVAASAPVSIRHTSEKRIEHRAIAPKKHAVATVSPIRTAHKAISAAAPATLSSAKRKGGTATPVVAKKNPSLTVCKKPVVVPLTPVAVLTQPAQPAQTAQPNEAFRQAQAAKAEKILHDTQNPKPEASATAPVEKVKPPKTPPIETKSPSSFSSPAKTAPRLYVPSDKKECPNCTSAVAAKLARCRCGYEFPSSGQLIPALSMSEEERAEFAKIFSSL